VTPRLALAGLEARVGLVYDVNAPLAAYHLAIRMARFERFDGCGYLHGNARKDSGKRVIKDIPSPFVNG